jgi:hypothetical protein
MPQSKQSSSRGVGVLSIIIICFLFAGGILAYWFQDATKFADRKDLLVSHTSFFPAECTISTPRDSDTVEKARAYFHNGSVRIDFDTNREGIKSGHEIITAEGMTYIWQEGEAKGVRLPLDKDNSIRSGVAEPNWWSCKPWFSVVSSKFTPPASVNFAQ